MPAASDFSIRDSKHPRKNSGFRNSGSECAPPMCIDAAPRDRLGGQTAPGELLRHHRRQNFCRLRAGRPERACGAVPSCHCDSGGRCVAERCRRPQGSILGVHDDLSCTRTCVWSSWSCMPTMQPCLSESRRDGKKGTGSKGVGWAHGTVASEKGRQISAILTPVFRAVPCVTQLSSSPTVDYAYFHPGPS